MVHFDKHQEKAITEMLRLPEDDPNHYQLWKELPVELAPPEDETKGVGEASKRMATGRSPREGTSEVVARTEVEAFEQG